MDNDDDPLFEDLPGAEYDDEGEHDLVDIIQHEGHIEIYD